MKELMKLLEQMRNLVVEVEVVAEEGRMQVLMRL